MSAALSASAGRKSLFAGLSATESAVLIRAVSPFLLQPAGLAQSRSCFRHAQSSLSVQGSSNCPPRCLYVNASTFCPAVQLGPHQLPCILTRVNPPIRMTRLRFEQVLHRLKHLHGHERHTFDQSFHEVQYCLHLVPG